MRILFLTGRESSYPRGKIIRSGLTKAGVNVIDCTIESRSLLLRTIYLLWRFFREPRRSYDVIFVGFFGQPFVRFIRLFTKKIIVFDAHLSAYNTAVEDKQLFRPDSIGARLMRYIDESACRNSNAVLLDTQQHINYFVEKYSLPRELFHRVWVGADEEMFMPRAPLSKREKKFTVLFHGGFIPLQGVEYIVRCAKELEACQELEFVIVGNGQTFVQSTDLARALSLRNIQFVGLVNPDEIPEYISNSDIGLGIFGDTAKAQRVIPNKVFELVAMAKPVITADTPAIRELFQDRKDIFLCRHADPKSLADAVCTLLENPSLRNSIAVNGYRTFMNNCTVLQIGEEVKRIAQSVWTNNAPKD